MEVYPLTTDYIAGLISVMGSFMVAKNKAGQAVYTFQLKMEGAQIDLLRSIAERLGLKETVHEYKYETKHFVVLLVRDRESIIKCLIPAFDERLFGMKRTQYETWRAGFYNDVLNSKYKKYLIQML